jgi:hypothetical protein
MFHFPGVGWGRGDFLPPEKVGSESRMYEANLGANFPPKNLAIVC